MLNKAATDLNIQMSLCLGHDILFQKYCEAPVTILVAKDRVLANNPMGVACATLLAEQTEDLTVHN